VIKVQAERIDIILAVAQGQVLDPAQIAAPYVKKTLSPDLTELLSLYSIKVSWEKQ
jgi:hypothetical protein